MDAQLLPRNFRGKYQIGDEPTASGEPCWEWTASRNWKGYGMAAVLGAGNTQRPAHRLAYEALVGPIPEGMALDHLCEVRHCINPAHLEPVTALENNRRSWARRRARGEVA